MRRQPTPPTPAHGRCRRTKPARRCWQRTGAGAGAGGKRWRSWGQWSDELRRCVSDFELGGRRLEVEQRADVAAHGHLGLVQEPLEGAGVAALCDTLLGRSSWTSSPSTSRSSKAGPRAGGPAARRVLCGPPILRPSSGSRGWAPTSCADGAWPPAGPWRRWALRRARPAATRFGARCGAAGGGQGGPRQQGGKGSPGAHAVAPIGPGAVCLLQAMWPRAITRPQESVSPAHRVQPPHQAARRWRAASEQPACGCGAGRCPVPGGPRWDAPGSGHSRR